MLLVKPGCGLGGVRVSYEVRPRQKGRGVRSLCFVTFFKTGSRRSWVLRRQVEDVERLVVRKDGCEHALDTARSSRWFMQIGF
jgi:hypothetical protein